MLVDGSRRLAAGDHLLSGSAPRATARAAYVEGFEHWQARHYEQAAGRFAVAARARNPRMAETALFYQAAAEGNRGQPGRALQTLRGFGVRFPDSRRADYCRYFVGVYAERLGRRTEAAIAYRSVEGNLRAVARARLARLESRPTSGLVLAFRKAWAARDSQTCAALVERMLRETPKDLMVTGGNAHFYRWVCAGRLGRTVEAIGHIDRFLARHPKHPSVDYSLYFKAVYLLRLGRHAVARQTLDRLDRDHPRSSLSQHAAALRARLPRR